MQLIIDKKPQYEINVTSNARILACMQYIHAGMLSRALSLFTRHVHDWHTHTNVHTITLVQAQFCFTRAEKNTKPE